MKARTPQPQDKIRHYRGVAIFRNWHNGYYTARVDVPEGGQRLMADTLAGLKAMISEHLNRKP